MGLWAETLGQEWQGLASAGRKVENSPLTVPVLSVPHPLGYATGIWGPKCPSITASHEEMTAFRCWSAHVGRNDSAQDAHRSRGKTPQPSIQARMVQGYATARPLTYGHSAGLRSFWKRYSRPAHYFLGRPCSNLRLGLPRSPGLVTYPGPWHQPGFLSSPVHEHATRPWP